jgi:hypothetical protein
MDDRTQVGASTAATARSLSAALSAQLVWLDLLLIEVAHRAFDPFGEPRTVLLVHPQEAGGPDAASSATR